MQITVAWKFAEVQRNLFAGKLRNAVTLLYHAIVVSIVRLDCTYKAPGWQQVTYSTSATKRGDTSSFQDTQEHRVLSQKFIEFKSSTSGHQPPNP